MSAPVDVLAVLDAAIDRVARPHEAGLHDARTAVSELIEIARLVSASLQGRIDANNAMTPQAVMTRRLAAAVAKATGGDA